jgi:membrane-associated protease RseP (regulator of RpoE activity)
MVGTATTPYDLRFRLLDIPVRIHPLFWLVTLLMGWREGNLPAIFIWVVCVTVSILVHEFGHGLMARQFNGSPSIVLWGLGGLCFSQGERTPGQRLAVLIAGPGAGFLLLGLVFLVFSLVFKVTLAEHISVIAYQLGISTDTDFRRVVSALMKISPISLEAGPEQARPSLFFVAYENLVFINFAWNLINLLPIYPLDGGQITQVLLTQVNRSQGVRWSHIVSLVTAGICATLVFTFRQEDYFLTIMLGMLAFMNFQILQALHQSESFGASHREDWWKN